MRVVVPLLLVMGVVGACGGDDTVPAPKGVTFQVEQTRQDLQGRRFQVQVVNEGGKDLTVEHVECSLDRAARLSQSGIEQIKSLGFHLESILRPGYYCETARRFPI